MIITQTPLRISLVGGGTDFEDFYSVEGGAVLSTAIDKYVFVIVKGRFDDMIYVNYSKKEIVRRVSDLHHELVREAMMMTGVEKGVEITTLADVPSQGTGLGSSSSITVGLLHALYTYQGKLPTQETLASEACQIEIDTLKNPIGKQDQYIASYGNMRFITFEKDGIGVEEIRLSQEDRRRIDENLMLIYTGITRKSSHILTEQVANIGNQSDNLRKLKELAFKAKDLILQGAFDGLGEVLHESWELKKHLASRITNPEIDALYEAARKAGAIGGKICGAGGGGFLLLYCPKVKRDEVRRILKGVQELPFRLERDGSKVIFNYRRSNDERFY